MGKNEQLYIKAKKKSLTHYLKHFKKVFTSIAGYCPVAGPPLLGLTAPRQTI